MAVSRVSRIHGLALLAALAAGACGRGEPPAASLTLTIAHVIDGAPIRVGQTYPTRYGQRVTFDHLRYWVSNVELVAGEKRFAVPASYYLVEQTPVHDRLSITIGGIPPGTYDKLVFHIGVDPPHNASLDLVEGELAAGIGMDWSWDTGYKFLRTEGHYEQGSEKGTFSFHTGTNVLYKQLTAELPAPLRLVADQTATVKLQAEIDRLFAGVQLPSEATIAGGTVDSPAAKVAGNHSRMFRLITDAGEVALTVTSPNLEGPPDGPVPSDSTPPVLSAAVVDLTGDLFCAAVPQRPAAEERACVTPYQHLPASGATYDAGLFTFVTKNGAPVLAAAGGVVSDIRYVDHSLLTHSDLYTVSVRPNEDSAFWMEYHNVKDLKVSEGSSVTAGQVLGGAGDYFDPSVGLVAFGVRRQQEVTQRLCPTRYLTAEVEARYQSAREASNAAWPGFVHADLCTSVSLVCTGSACESPASFVPAGGDVDEGRRIYKTGCALCHGDKGQGSVGPALCAGSSCGCPSCVDPTTLAARIQQDMPPEGECDARCSADVAAFIFHEFSAP